MNAATGAIGASDNALEIDLSANGVLNATADLGVDLAETGGDMNLDRVQATDWRCHPHR